MVVVVVVRIVVVVDDAATGRVSHSLHALSTKNHIYFIQADSSFDCVSPPKMYSPPSSHTTTTTCLSVCLYIIIHVGELCCAILTELFLPPLTQYTK